VHASLKAVGYVVGGATAVVQALLDALGPDGTLVVPAQTAGNRDPSTWGDVELPAECWPVIRDNLPGFDPALTPSSGMGRIAEQVRTWPGAQRSDHPQTSFVAVGPRARFLMADHRLTSPLGEHSPLARLEEVGARVLLLGVGFESSTCFHLAEYRIPDPPRRMNACAVVGPAGREWIEYPGIRLHDQDFGQLGKAFEHETDVAVRGRVGAATCNLFPLGPAVHFARSWLLNNRKLEADPA